jgi:cyclopropane fatty-acyl-phospholipid synthase-like methyltransferase
MRIRGLGAKQDRQQASVSRDDARYARSAVGPAEHYDLIAAMTFGLLTSLGLRENHHLLDIGCGSLRVGRLLIPYLGIARYTGIEPNGKAIETGLKLHVGAELQAIRKPVLVTSSDPGAVPKPPSGRPFDFAFAQSVFSHTGPDLLAGWLEGVAPMLSESGVLAATYVPGADNHQPGWTEEFFTYSEETMRSMASAAGLGFRPIDWRHPGQRWALFTKAGFETDWLPPGGPTWNAYLEHELGPPAYAKITATPPPGA